MPDADTVGPVENVVRYLPVTPRDRAWGLYVTGAGKRVALPHSNYYRDDSSRYTWRKGRTLPEYGMVYVASGQGVFVSRQTGKQQVSAGDLLLLFPDVWHNYRPHPNTGWVEYWILFNGAQLERMVEHGLIGPSSAVLRLGATDLFEQLFRDFLRAVEAQSVLSSHVLSALASQILANALSRAGLQRADAGERASEIEQAKLFIEEHLRDAVDMQELAESLNMSYRNFRRVFKQKTGMAPQQYHMQLRINRAKELLEDQDNRVNEVALRVGFGDQFYFSRMFRKYAGLSPSQWRDTRGRMAF